MFSNGFHFFTFWLVSVGLARLFFVMSQNVATKNRNFPNSNFRIAQGFSHKLSCFDCDIAGDFAVFLSPM
jgi:hypothetical protein